MKKVTAFVASAHKRNTHDAVVEFKNTIQKYGDVDFDLVTLNDYKLGFCRGCRVCFEIGEERCPLKDDRDILFKKIDESDGIIFASPNYCFHMTGVMKAFIDRLGYTFHRPRFFGKAFTSIVVQGFGGGKEMVKYFDMIAKMTGFSTVKGITSTSFDPKPPKVVQKLTRDIEGLSKKFYEVLSKPGNPTPSFEQLVFFRGGRTTIKQLSDRDSIDYHYYQDRGWLESDYYYPTNLGLIKKATGSIVDSMTPMLRALIS